MIKAMGIKIGIVLLLLSGTVIEAVPTLTIDPPAPNTGSTFTLTCELPGFTNAVMNFDKVGSAVYGCASGGQTCNNNGGLSDYSEVDWQTNKGIVTISNADQTRDGGDWTCTVGGGGGTSVAETVEITATTTAAMTTPSTTVSPSTTTTIPGTTVTNTTTGTTNHSGGPTTYTIPPTTDSPSPLPVSVIIAIAAGVGLVIVIGITIAIVYYSKRKSKIKETVDDRHSSGIDNHGIDLKEHSNRDHHL